MTLGELGGHSVSLSNEVNLNLLSHGSRRPVKACRVADTRLVSLGFPGESQLLSGGLRPASLKYGITSPKIIACDRDRRRHRPPVSGSPASTRNALRAF